MISFECDYNVGVHEKILERMQELNPVRQKGYGEDVLCRSASEKIRKACECPEAEVYFLTGGTQTNAIVLGTVLARYEGVIAAKN